jgi:hypothetical protein
VNLRGAAAHVVLAELGAWLPETGYFVERR